MFIDLSTIVTKDSPLIQWAKTQDNPHIAMGHIGTHLDTYEKTDIPLDFFKSKGVLFDVRKISQVGSGDIDLSDIPQNAFVIFRTGQIETHAYGDKLYFKNHPVLSDELICELLEKKIRFIGIDSPGIREGIEHEIADRLCEKNGVYVIENLKNLSEITSSDFNVYTLWDDNAEQTGLKCRVIVEIL